MVSDFFGIRVGPKRCLGVDIGTSAIKIVELSQQGKRKKLDNYGEIEAVSLYEKPFRTFEKSTLTIDNSDVVKAITAILKEARMKTNKAYFSLPDFSTFFTAFRLPSMTKEELPKAVQDWQVINQKTIDKKISDFNILLVAVPNEVIQQYQDIARFSKLEILGLEAEVFGLVRSLIKEEDKSTVILFDLGARSTTVSIVDSGVIKISHSFDTSGSDFTNLIARGLNLEMREAEKVKKEQGLLSSGKSAAREAVLPMIDLILGEAKKISQDFYLQESRKPQKIILAGGSAFLPGLVEYFSEVMGIGVEIADPFADTYYPPILNETLKKMGPAFAVAVGTALRGIE